MNHLCGLFSVHRSSYKAWRGRPTELSVEEMQLRERIKAAHQLSNSSSGARTISRMITAEGVPLSRYRIARRMAALGLVSSQQPKHRYKKAEQPHLNIPNLLARQFDVGAPNKVWAGAHWSTFEPVAKKHVSIWVMALDLVYRMY